MNYKVIERFSLLYGHPPTVVAHAPGRIEFIGNHTDYNGGTVLGAASQHRRLGRGGARTSRGSKLRHRFPARHRCGANIESRPAKRSATLGELSPRVWTSFREFGLKQPDGLEYLALSNLPVGAGLSSSAAIELASALAYLGLTGRIRLEKP